MPWRTFSTLHTPKRTTRRSAASFFAKSTDRLGRKHEVKSGTKLTLKLHTLNHNNLKCKIPDKLKILAESDGVRLGGYCCTWDNRRHGEGLSWLSRSHFKTKYSDAKDAYGWVYLWLNSSEHRLVDAYFAHRKRDLSFFFPLAFPKPEC